MSGFPKPLRVVSGEQVSAEEALKLYDALDEWYAARLAERDGFTFEGDLAAPHVFIQWKGTDVCFDITCECGWHGHFDGYFAYLVKCGRCERVWEMPWHVFPRPSERDDGMTPVEPRP